MNMARNIFLIVGSILFLLFEWMGNTSYTYGRLFFDIFIILAVISLLFSERVDRWIARHD
jgi:hypothetical protein